MPPARASPTRMFSNKAYITDFTIYATREDANAKIQECKTSAKVSARVVSRKDGFLIYFEQACYETLFGEIPPEVKDQIAANAAELEKPEPKPVESGLVWKKKAAKKAGAKKAVKKRAAKKGAARPRRQYARVSEAEEEQSTVRTPKPSKNSLAGTTPRAPAARVTTGPPPPYLLARMNKDAQKYYLAKDQEFQKLPPKQVDRFIEIFTAELLKFDANFEKELPVIDRIREILSILNEQKKKNDDQAIIDFCNEKIKKPLNEGKLDKVIQKYAGFNARTVADGIMKALGRSRKECPLSDIALAKEIIAILAEKFPDKFTNTD